MDKDDNNQKTHDVYDWIFSHFFDRILFSDKQIEIIIGLKRTGDLYIVGIYNRIKFFLIVSILYLLVMIILLFCKSVTGSYYYMIIPSCMYIFYVYMYRSMQWLYYSIGDVFEGSIVNYKFVEFGSGYGSNIVYEYIDNDKKNIQTLSDL